MSIQDVVLFVSSISQACILPVQFIQENRFPAKLVRLDTIIDRQAAANGKYIQIHIVPTLLITYSDGNIQLFAGQEKVLMWLQQAFKSFQSSIALPSPPLGSMQPGTDHVTKLESDKYEEPRRPKKRSLKGKSRSSTRSKKRRSKKIRLPPSPKKSGGYRRNCREPASIRRGRASRVGEHVP